MGASSKAVKGLAEALEAAGKGASKAQSTLKVLPEAKKAALTAMEHTEADPAEFAKIIESVRQNPNPLYSANITPYSADEYGKMKTYLSPDKKSGYAIKEDGELVSVFSLEKGRGRGVVFDAIANKGAQKLDAFDINNKLPSLYSEFMDETDRLKFNREYAPKDWNYDKLGEPDVTFMKTNPEKVKKSLAAALEERLPGGLPDSELRRIRESMSPEERTAYFRNLDQLFGSSSERQKLTGHTEKAFHGSQSPDLKQVEQRTDWKPNLFASDQPSFASGYASESGHVYPLRLRPGKRFDPKNVDHLKQIEKEIGSVKSEFDLPGAESKGEWLKKKLKAQAGDPNATDYNLIEQPEAISAMKEKGFDSLQTTVSDIDEPVAKNTGVLNTGQVRSEFAAFDPRYKDSKYILAADSKPPNFMSKAGPTQAELAAQKIFSAVQKMKQDEEQAKNLEGARDYVKQAQEEPEKSALEQTSDALSAPQRKLVSEPLAKLTGQKPSGDAEQDFTNVVQRLSEKANLSQDPITNAGKALAVGALTIGADPLNAIAAPFKGASAIAKAAPKGLDKLMQALRGGEKVAETAKTLTTAEKAANMEPKAAEAALKLRKPGQEAGGGKIIQKLSTADDLIKNGQAAGPTLPQPKNVEHIRYKNELTKGIFEDMEEFVKRHPNATQDELRQAVRAFEKNRVQTLGPVPKKKD